MCNLHCIKLFAFVFHILHSFLSQSELSHFFVYIINDGISDVWFSLWRPSGGAPFSDQCSLQSTLQLWEILQDHMAYPIRFSIANDSQLYLSFKVHLSRIWSLANQRQKPDIDSWMIINKSKMNSDKTEILVFTLSHRSRPAWDFVDIVVNYCKEH